MVHLHERAVLRRDVSRDVGSAAAENAEQHLQSVCYHMSAARTYEWCSGKKYMSLAEDRTYTVHDWIRMHAHAGGTCKPDVGIVGGWAHVPACANVCKHMSPISLQG